MKLVQKNYKSAMLLIYCVFILFFIASTQKPAYIHFNSTNGLPSNLVHCGMQDKKGLLWFGTDKGLLRFDGRKFQIFTMKDGLPDSEVFSIKEDDEERIWISCFRKNICFVKDGIIVTSAMDTILKEIKINYGVCDFYKDIDGSVWVSTTTNDLYKIHNFKPIYFSMPSAVVQVQRIGNTLLALGSGYIFEIVDKSGVNQIFNIVKELNGIPTYSGVTVSENRILYSFFKDLLLLEFKDNIINVVSKIKKPIGRVFTDKKGRFWICSPAIGAICFNNSSRDFSNPVLYLPGKKAIYMFEDHQGTFWFCTLDDGIYGLTEQSPLVYNIESGLPSNNIVSASKDISGSVSCGDDEGNLNIFFADTFFTKEYKSVDGYNRVLGVLPMNSNEKFIVTDENLYLESSNFLKIINTIGTTPKSILLCNDSLWIGTSSRLFLISTKLMDSINQISKIRITSLGMDSDHTIWAGGIEGIYASSDSFISNWGDIHPLLRSRIVAIQQGGPNQLWVVTPESGLLDCSVRNGKITKVVRVNSLLKRPVENIQSIFREESGRLWMATNTGIYGLYPDTWEVVQYNRFDGLADNDVRAIVVFKDTLWAGTASGITRMVLREEPANGDFPTYVTAVRYQRQKTVYEINTLDSIPNEREMLLPSDASLVEVEFTGLDYRSRGNLRYECIITDVLLPFRWWTIDNAIDWIYSGFKGTIDTTVINRPSLAFGVSWPAGRYNINVLALTTRKTRSNQSDTCNIIMRPYWYTTLWFQMIVWALILSLFYQAFQTRAQLREMAISVAQSRFMALQAQINPHFIGNAINAMQRFFYPPSPMKANIYTSTLIQILRKTLYYSEKVFLPFHEEIQYSTDYMELANLRLDKGKFYYEFLGVASIRKNMPFPALFLQPILENATIHGTAKSGITKVIVTFSQKKGRIVCAIQDNGPGIFSNLKKQSEKQEGFRRSRGLAMLKDKADTLNQLYNIDLQITAEDLSDRSAVFHGTRITLSFLAAKAIEAQNHPSLIKLSDDNFSVDSIKIQTRP